MGIEKTRYVGLLDLVTQARHDSVGLWPWLEGEGGSDNQKALGFAAGYLADAPDARQAVWSWYARQLAGTPGLMGNEPLSRPYFHYHWAPAQAVRWQAWQTEDRAVYDLVTEWCRLLLGALALLACRRGNTVESEAPCARASWERSIHADLALQAALGLPLSKTTGPYVEWRDPAARSLGLGLQRKLAEAGQEIFTPEERRQWLAWIDTRQGTPPSLAFPLASPLVVEIRPGGALVAYYRKLSSYDDPQPGIALVNGEVRRLRPTSGHVYAHGDVVTAIDGDRLVCRAPLGEELFWTAEIPLPPGPVVRSFEVQGAQTVADKPPARPPRKSPSGDNEAGRDLQRPTREEVAQKFRRSAKLLVDGNLDGAKFACERGMELFARLMA